MPITVTGSFTTTASGAVMVFCNALVSELMRDIKSPVRDWTKKPTERFWRWANNRVRKSVMARMATHCRQYTFR